jgi:hypothetical protein
VNLTDDDRMAYGSQIRTSKAMDSVYPDVDTFLTAWNNGAWQSEESGGEESEKQDPIEHAYDESDVAKDETAGEEDDDEEDNDEEVEHGEAADGVEATGDDAEEHISDYDLAAYGAGFTTEDLFRKAAPKSSRAVAKIQPKKQKVSVSVEKEAQPKKLEAKDNYTTPKSNTHRRDHSKHSDEEDASPSVRASSRLRNRNRAVEFPAPATSTASANSKRSEHGNAEIKTPNDTSSKRKASNAAAGTTKSATKKQRRSSAQVVVE